MGHLDGKVAIVTGAAFGMGRATAITLAREGAKVVAWDLGVSVEGRPLDSNPVDDTVQLIQDEGNDAVAFHGDVSSMADAENAIGTALDKYGKLDILVCAAGILRERMIFNMAEEEWDDVVRVHLKGTFAPAKFASIHWRQRREYGRLIAFSSTAALGSPGQPNYAAAKMAIIGFTRACAGGLVRYNVTSNAIFPGASTRMTDRGLAAQEAIKAGKPLPSQLAAGTEGDPFNNAPAIAFLASEQAGHITGRIFGTSGWTYRLYSDEEVVRHLHTDKPWDIDWLFKTLPDTLFAGLEPTRGLSAEDAAAARREQVARQLEAGARLQQGGGA